MERTIKQTKGELNTERQISFANALKAADREKDAKAVVQALVDWFECDEDDYMQQIKNIVELNDD